MQLTDISIADKSVDLMHKMSETIFITISQIRPAVKSPKYSVHDDTELRKEGNPHIGEDETKELFKVILEYWLIYHENNCRFLSETPCHAIKLLAELTTEKCLLVNCPFSEYIYKTNCNILSNLRHFSSELIKKNDCMSQIILSLVLNLFFITQYKSIIL